jgi:7-cyano-7-deazaguanine synthase in queuosine biosynthesis
LRVARHIEIDVDLAPSGIDARDGAIPDRDLTIIPSTYVPARNTIFLARAGWAEVMARTPSSSA